MKNNRNKIIVSVIFGFATFLVGGYLFVAGADSNTNINNETKKSEENLDILIKEYYKERKWSEEGIPTKEKLEELEIAWTIESL